MAGQRSPPLATVVLLVASSSISSLASSQLDTGALAVACSRLWRRKEDEWVQRVRARQALFRNSSRRKWVLDPELDPRPNATVLWGLVAARDRPGARASARAMRSLFDAFEPDWACDSEERVGGRAAPFRRYEAFGDGPKFMCGLEVLRAAERCLTYSVGSKNQYQFERAVKLLTGCEIHTFDPTLRTGFGGGAYAAFHPVALGRPQPRAARAWMRSARSLPGLMRELGHEGRRLDVLKVDCEGCEYSGVFEELFGEMQSGKLDVGQILLEMHVKTAGDSSPPRLTFDGLVGWFDAAAAAGFRMFHKERNGWGCSGWKCVEFAFISRRAACEAFVSTHCPDAGLLPAAVCGPAPSDVRGPITYA